MVVVVGGSKNRVGGGNEEERREEEEENVLLCVASNIDHHHHHHPPASGYTTFFSVPANRSPAPSKKSSYGVETAGHTFFYNRHNWDSSVLKHTRFRRLRSLLQDHLRRHLRPRLLRLPPHLLHPHPPPHLPRPLRHRHHR